jgi:hypothetical protein
MMSFIIIDVFYYHIIYLLFLQEQIKDIIRGGAVLLHYYTRPCFISFQLCSCGARADPHVRR